jgi:pimeloyl-ACP methyl ester carboxylesterase
VPLIVFFRAGYEMEFIEKIHEGYATFGAYQTWYRVTGDLASGRTPLVIIHGGPGCTHDYVDAFKDVAASGHAVIHYDQLDRRPVPQRTGQPAGSSANQRQLRDPRPVLGRHARQ